MYIYMYVFVTVLTRCELEDAWKAEQLCIHKLTEPLDPSDVGIFVHRRYTTRSAAEVRGAGGCVLQ